MRGSKIGSPIITKWTLTQLYPEMFPHRLCLFSKLNSLVDVPFRNVWFSLISRIIQRETNIFYMNIKSAKLYEKLLLDTDTIFFKLNFDLLSPSSYHYTKVGKNIFSHPLCILKNGGFLEPKPKSKIKLKFTNLKPLISIS